MFKLESTTENTYRYSLLTFTNQSCDFQRIKFTNGDNGSQSVTSLLHLKTRNRLHRAMTALIIDAIKPIDFWIQEDINQEISLWFITRLNSSR